MEHPFQNHLNQHSLRAQSGGFKLGRNQTTASMISLRLFVFVLSVVTSSLACSCDGRLSHPQKEFCNADFAIRVRVALSPRDSFMPNNNRIILPSWVYTVRILEIFKGYEDVTRNMYSLFYAKLYTSSNSNLSCRVNLETGKEYFVCGEIKAGNLFRDFCGRWCLQPWKMLTPVQVAGIRTEYRKGCLCLIGGLLQGCNVKQAPFKARLCRSRHLLCAVDENRGQCFWKSTNNSYERCMKS